MAQAAGERIAYHNGRCVPEREVLVPFRDRGFKFGDAVFDTTRLCPVRSVNGVPIGGEGVPGPVTRQLTDAYARLVDCDFVGQYLKRLG